MGYISHIDGSYYEGDIQEGDSVGDRPPPTVQQQKDAIQAQIDSLERAQLLPRIARDIFILQIEEKAIALGDAQIPALDAATSLAVAYASNIGYQRLKDFDAQITILRNQMEAIV